MQNRAAYTSSSHCDRWGGGTHQIVIAPSCHQLIKQCQGRRADDLDDNGCVTRLRDGLSARALIRVAARIRASRSHGTEALYQNLNRQLRGALSLLAMTTGGTAAHGQHIQRRFDQDVCNNRSTSLSVRICGSISGCRLPSGKKTYSGTPSRPFCRRNVVMAGSWRVQSPFRYATPPAANAARTVSVEIATRSFSKHVTHQAAVMLTNTGRPSAHNAARRSGVYGSATLSVAAPTG